MSKVREILQSRRFRTRLLSGIVLILVAVAAISAGGAVLLCTMAVISLIGLFELYRVVKMEREPIGLIGYIGGGAYYLLLWYHEGRYGIPVLIGVLMALMAVFVITYPRYRTEQIAVGFMGIPYTVVMFSYVYRTRTMPDGLYLVWLIFLASWGCDTCAYVTGMLFGRHHFVKELSPKKTVEGALGGTLGAALRGALYAVLFSARLQQLVDPAPVCFFACAVGAVISQVGDLAASAIKRDHGVKDYGTLIPGHGGILDRFDSMLFTAPAVYFALYIYDVVRFMR